MPKVSFNFNLEPTEAIEYLKNKGFKLSFDYTELQKEAHHKAFTVAKVTRADLLNYIFEAIVKGIEKGESFKEFQKNIKPTLQKKGWWGEQEIINPNTGEIKKVDIGSRRLKNIYDTNTRVAYSVGRYNSQMLSSTKVYLRYVSRLLANTREAHRAMHGIIKHRDDVFWEKNYPQNGWGCVCKAVAYSQKDLDRKGWEVTKEDLQDIASNGWDYNVGKSGSNVGKLSQINLDKSLETLPKVQKNTDYENLSDVALLGLFYQKLGVNKGDVFIDKIGDPMVIDDSLFHSAGGFSKIRKQDRHLFLDEIADTIADPDEIYLEWDEKAKRIVKKMFKYLNNNDKTNAILVIFEYLEDKTQGVSAYHMKSESQIEKRRIEKLIYKKED